MARSAKIVAQAALALLGAVEVPAFAQSCNSTITSNLTLTADLDLTGCTGTALTFGADGITIDGQVLTYALTGPESAGRSGA